MNKDEKARFTLRIPQELYDQLKYQAEKNKRSVIKEIEFILENNLPPAKDK